MLPCYFYHSWLADSEKTSRVVSTWRRNLELGADETEDLSSTVGGGRGGVGGGGAAEMGFEWFDLE